MLYKKKKYIPYFSGFNGFSPYKHEDFYCYYAEGFWDKYGLHYTFEYSDGKNVIKEEIHKKGKRYSKPPYAFNSYEEMMIETEKYERSLCVANDIGDIRKEAVYLILDLDENGILLNDAHSFDGYVSKRGTIFNITNSGYYDGKKSFALTDKNRHLVFSDIKKAADYIMQHYGDWAMFHYLKNFPDSL